MIVFVIVGGMFLGWIIGNRIFDMWINNGMKEVNEEEKNKPLD